MQPPHHPAGTGQLAHPNVAALGATSEPVQEWPYANYTQGSVSPVGANAWGYATTSGEPSQLGGPSQPRNLRSDSMSTQSTAYSSVFSGGAKSQTWSDQTSVLPFDAPHAVPYTHQPHLPATTGTAHRPDEILWCEQIVQRPCGVTFPLDDLDGWIEHNLTHLPGRGTSDADFPSTMWCWFCNDIVFEPRNPGEGYACFVTRMEHIRQHIFDDPHLTSERMRPDFPMVKHLYAHRMLSEACYRAAMAYTEIPLPGEQQSLYSSASTSARPLGQHRPIWPASHRPAGVKHDLAKEKRDEKRRAKKKAPASAGGGAKKGK
ncbi:hypothetical protein C8A05DRAFT_32390 [Staphylotrichum tortipilum]|uniref:Uncharacterized protein n=1 Tax=Staphylotrichum tortipilum TaxID=2831512 RepID=A0AAN6RV38_9PEZI|nr:hypothetical protein C8A05DRAFT_32390 [Staphylotrichum longicolle]